MGGLYWESEGDCVEAMVLERLLRFIMPPLGGSYSGSYFVTWGRRVSQVANIRLLFRATRWCQDQSAVQGAVLLSGWCSGNLKNLSFSDWGLCWGNVAL